MTQSLRCECGSTIAGLLVHSDWCMMSGIQKRKKEIDKIKEEKELYRKWNRTTNKWDVFNTNDQYIRSVEDGTEEQDKMRVLMP